MTFVRGGKETLKAGGHCCWTSSYGITISGRSFRTVVLLCLLQSSFVNKLGSCRCIFGRPSTCNHIDMQDELWKACIRSTGEVEEYERMTQAHSENGQKHKSWVESKEKRGETYWLLDIDIHANRCGCVRCWSVIGSEVVPKGYRNRC